MGISSRAALTGVDPALDGSPYGGLSAAELMMQAVGTASDRGQRVANLQSVRGQELTGGLNGDSGILPSYVAAFNLGGGALGTRNT